ncbi:hypothetical protein KKC88_00595, partial [Patescibacteria group bacterium]|nr:hypothetical protein [Patescibacteria group bacterium]
YIYMQFIKDIDWSEIYDNWRFGETKDDFWRDYYEREGFSNWEDFRDKYINALRPEEYQWSLFKVNPVEIAEFKCGAFEGWLDVADEARDRKFCEICKTSHFSGHPKVEEIKKQFPSPTQLIGMYKNEEVFLLEGNHRAIAVCQIKKAQLENKEITLALCNLRDDREYPFVDYSLK